MSAPDTNLEKQKRRHRGPLIGMAVVLTFVAIIFLANLGSVAQNGQTPQATGTQIDGRTGESVAQTPAVDGSGGATTDVPATPAPLGDPDPAQTPDAAAQGPAEATPAPAP